MGEEPKTKKAIIDPFLVIINHVIPTPTRLSADCPLADLYYLESCQSKERFDKAANQKRDLIK
jgi:hypothetical protein